VISTSRRRSRFEIASGWHQDHDIAERADDRPASARLEGDPVAEPHRRVVLAEVDPDHEAAAAHLRDLGHRCDLREQLVQEPDLRLQADDRPLAPERVEVRQSGRAGERVAGVGVAVEEGAVLLVPAEETLVDPLRRQRRCER